jgi:hypothetical protein
MASLYHAKIGTDTVTCYSKDAAMLILEKLIAMNQNIIRIAVQYSGDGGKISGTYYWIRSRDGNDISFFKNKEIHDG